MKASAAPFVPGGKPVTTAAAAGGNAGSSGAASQGGSTGSNSAGVPSSGSFNSLNALHAAPFVPSSSKLGPSTPGTSAAAAAAASAAAAAGQAAVASAGTGATPGQGTPATSGGKGGQGGRGQSGGRNTPVQGGYAAAGAPAGPVAGPGPNSGGGRGARGRGGMDAGGRGRGGRGGHAGSGAQASTAAAQDGSGGASGGSGYGYGGNSSGATPFGPHSPGGQYMQGQYMGSGGHYGGYRGAPSGGYDPTGMGGAGSMAAALGHLPQSRPHEAHMTGHGRAAVSLLFMSDALRQQLATASYAIQAQWQPTGADDGTGPLPERIGVYHSLYPLEEIEGITGRATQVDPHSRALGLRTAVLKGVSAADGQAYALRRIDGKQVIPSADLLAACRAAIEAWAPIANHPHLAAPRSTFVSSELDGSPALFFVHDFHPGCVTLAAAHLAPSAAAGGGVVAAQAPSEQVLWSYAVQLAGALRAAHAAGLALRPGCLHPSKVLVSPFGRLRISCPAVLDGLAGDLAADRDDLHRLHRLDLTALGQLLLALACAGLVPPGHAGTLEMMMAPPAPGMAPRYSPELCRLVGALLSSARGGALGTARQLVAGLADRSLAEAEAGALAQDALLSELGREVENGRLLRLLVKLGFINERPEGDVDGSWAETGDRYLLKLFRDFVFHQRAPEGHPGAGGPLLDWGHVVEALNKLDAGVPERVMLLARDEAAMLVASYSDLKRCVDAAYGDLRSRASAAVARNKGLAVAGGTPVAGATPTVNRALQ